MKRATPAGATFTVDADADSVMVIAYQDGDAFLFKVTDGANGRIDTDDITQVAIFDTLTNADDLVAANFI